MRRKEPAATILFEREKLYDEIWAEPILQVAKRYGISDVGLAKICKRMKIPKPPRGYWAKLSYGVRTKREPLRPATLDTPLQIIVDRTTQQMSKLHDQRRIQNPSAISERQKIRQLKIALRDMEVARRTRLYLDAMRALPNATEPEQAEWLAWVAQYADHIDPTINFTLHTLKPPKPKAPVYKFTAQGFVDD
jgi:hypothetical protein